MKQLDFDALIVGAGFGGLYQLYKLRGLGMSVQLIDAAGDVGGTWYWNRYPGATSDTEAYLYRYSWDKEDLLQYPWKDHYLKQIEVFTYLKHVVERHDLRKHTQFNTEMRSASFDEEMNVWRIETSTDESFTARYLVTALGLLSKQNWPDIKGINKYQGELYHTGNWPPKHDFVGKRVGVIGCGSTGVQVITAISKEVKQLVCFQRHPQYVVPSGDGPVSKEYRDMVNANYDQIWDGVWNSKYAFGFKESTVPAMSVSEEERQRIFQENWDKGNGFRFMYGTFCDISVDEKASESACEFIRAKIAEIVEDPEKRRKLTPRDLYARRPVCNAGYYESFNRDGVDIVDLKETPITEMTSHGIRTSDGAEHELDVIILATGFDAVDGNYTRIYIRGRNGQSLQDHWHSAPTSYLGISVPEFPNLFMLGGPNGPFANIPPGLETQVEFIADIIAHAKQINNNNCDSESNNNNHDHQAPAAIEATPEAERDWTDLCRQLSDNSLFKKTDSWIFGANVPGKMHTVMFFFGGLAKYRERLAEIVKEGYKGFKPFCSDLGPSEKNGSGEGGLHKAETHVSQNRQSPLS